jgi:hypothetical protein
MPTFLFSNGTFFNPASIPPLVNTPTAGQTVTMGVPSIYLTPAGTLATLTIRLPANPRVGFTATIVSTQAVTTLTMQTASGGAVAGAPTALVANTEVLMRWISAAVGWAWIR